LVVILELTGTTGSETTLSHTHCHIELLLCLCRMTLDWYKIYGNGITEQKLVSKGKC